MSAYIKYRYYLAYKHKEIITGRGIPQEICENYGNHSDHIAVKIAQGHFLLTTLR